jgi:hypothetical protein
MAMVRRTMGLLAGLAVVLAAGSPGYAQPCGGSSMRALSVSPAMVRASLGLSASLFRNAKVYTYPQILAQTLADKSPDAAEVHTYLRNPVQWQKNMNPSKTFELGLPRSRVILADGTIIRTYVRPLQLPQGWRYHLFMDPPPKGFDQFTLYDPTHLYLIQTPPGSALLQQLFGKVQTVEQGNGAKGVLVAAHPKPPAKR